MLSVDEAIAREREKAKEIRENIIDEKNLEPYESYCIAMAAKCVEEHEQLAEWLEELKALKNGLNIKCDNLNEALEKGKKVGYNKAIDDCLKIVEWDGYTLDIKHRIEQLKEGGENE